MRFLGRSVGILSFSFGVLAWGWQGEPPAVADFTFVAGAANPGNQFATAALDLPTGEQVQDSEPELTGAIKNQFLSGGKPIKDIKIWIENRVGDPLPSASGGCPVTDFSNSSTTGGALEGATLAGQVGNVATFNLTKPISNGATGSYNLQIGKLSDPVPNQIIVKMQASYERYSSTGALKHYDVLGSKSFRVDDVEQVFDVAQASIRNGVVLDALNADPQRALLGLRVTLVTANTELAIVGALVDDLTGSAIAGAGIQVAASGASVDITNLTALNAEGATVWLDLNGTYPRDTLFRVRGLY